jgi:NitT/TauT family transport system substrate-binding protein
LNTPTAIVAPAWIAKEQGFFLKYGIDAELVVLQTSVQLAAALIAGEVPISLTAATGTLNAALAGSDLVLLGGYANVMRFWLYGRPETTTVRDLRGKTLAITRRGGAIEQAATLALERHGLRVERDVALIQAGTTNDALTALLAGAVDSAILGTPGIFQAEDNGMRLLVDTADYRYPMIMEGVVASRAWVAQNRDLARRVLQALAEGLAFAHQHKERTKEIIGQYTRVTDERTLERTYETLVPGWDRTLHAPPEAVQAELQLLAQEVPAARTARPEQFLDTSIVEELERGGFFQQLYQ